MKALAINVVAMAVVLGVSGPGALAATVQVDTTTDEYTSESDGTGPCSLREAVDAMNTASDGRGCSNSSSTYSYGSQDRVVLDPGRYVLSIEDSGGTEASLELDNSVGDIDVTVDMDIESSGSPGETIIEPSTTFGDRAFFNSGAGNQLGLIGLHITGFRNGMYLRDTNGTDPPSNLRLENVIVSGNTGGTTIFGSEVKIKRSVFYDNTSDRKAGAVYASTLLAENSTFLRNHVEGAGGAIHIDDPAGSISRLDNLTITGNSAAVPSSGASGGGGVYLASNAEVEVRNTILFGNRSEGTGPDCRMVGTVRAGSDFNLVGDTGACGSLGTGASSLTGEDPKLGSPARYGDDTSFRPPLADSPVIDAGDCNDSQNILVGVDQRSKARPLPSDPEECDIGAVERNWTPRTVDSTGDTPDANPGDGTCADSSGDCTLRAAIDEANATAGLGEIVLPAETVTLSRAGSGEDANATGDLDVSDPLILRGQGAAASVVDGNGIDRVLHARGGSLAVHDLRITGGNPGGIYCGAPELNLVRTELVGNQTPSDGGGLGTFNCTHIRILGSTVRGNTADGNGGAIAIEGSRSFESVPDRLLVENSSIVNNEAVSGGGLYQVRQVRTDLDQVTIAGNTATGGQRHQLHVEAYSGTASKAALHGSIVAGAVTGTDCGTSGGGSPVIESLGHNIEDGTSCGFGLSGDGDQQNTVPDLAPLADAGGPVRLREPNAGSPAVDAGECRGAGGRIMGRQVFGGTRPQDAAASGASLGEGTYDCDIGAAERQQVRVTNGGDAPPARTVPAGSSGVVVAQFQLTNEAGESLQARTVTLRASGSGADGSDVTAIRLYVDEDSNGLLDTGTDTQVGTAKTFGGDDGAVTFDLSGLTNPVLSSGGSVELLVVYDFATQLARGVSQQGPLRVAAGLPAGLVVLAAVAGGTRRRRSWLAVALLTLTLALGGCGSGGSGSSSDGGNGSSPKAETYAVAVEGLEVRGATGGTMRIRVPAAPSADLTVEE